MTEQNNPDVDPWMNHTAMDHTGSKVGTVTAVYLDTPPTCHDGSQ